MVSKNGLALPHIYFKGRVYSKDEKICVCYLQIQPHFCAFPPKLLKNNASFTRPITLKKLRNGGRFNFEVQPLS